MFSDKVTYFYLADLFAKSYLCVCQTFVWISQVFPVAFKSSKGPVVARIFSRNVIYMTIPGS